jgi:hemin uptake protein HemP
MNEGWALSAHPTPGHEPADRDDRGHASADSLPPLASSVLLRGRSVVRIEHNGSLYQLRSTRLGKLILTK